MTPFGPAASPLMTRVLAALVAALFVGGITGVALVDEDGSAANIPVGEPADPDDLAGGEFDYEPGTTTTRPRPSLGSTTIPQSGIGPGTGGTNTPTTQRPGSGGGPAAGPATTAKPAAPGSGGGATTTRPASTGGGSAAANQAGPASSASEPGVYTVQPDGQGLYRVVPGGTGFPTWSPDGSKIVFAVPTSTPRYMVTTSDGSTRFTLANGNIGGAPAFSPDGGQVALIIGDGRGFDLWAVNTGGGNLRRLTSRGDVSGVAWSSKGRIAFTAGGDVMTVNPDGTGLATMIDATKAYRAITFSPDGTRLAYFANDKIFVAGASGENPKAVADPEGRLLEWNDISWSPDSTRLAFRSGTGGVSRVRVVGHDGTGNRISAENAQAPDWSPGGSRLSIFTAGPVRENGDREAHLELADPDRATFRQRVLDDRPGVVQSSGPRYSPDGGRLMFVTGGLDRGGPTAPAS
jgi:Tol biopolymer transport system component